MRYSKRYNVIFFVRERICLIIAFVITFVITFAKIGFQGTVPLKDTFRLEKVYMIMNIKSLISSSDFYEDLIFIVLMNIFLQNYKF